MAGINQGRPELAVGEPIRLGDDNDFEIEQHPASDRLIIRDTENGTVAYVKAERGGQIGGDGVLIKALKESKPMADTGRTYDTIQQAEREASSWVFVPPGTYNESVEINTEGLTLQGSGYNTFIDTGSLGVGISVDAVNCTIKNLRVENSAGDNNPAIGRPDSKASEGLTVDSVFVTGSNHYGIFTGPDSSIINCRVSNTGVDNGGFSTGINIDNGIAFGNIVQDNSNSNSAIRAGNSIVSNNIVRNNDGHGTEIANGVIYVGNRVINSGRDGIFVDGGENAIVANNRISDSGESDIDDNGTNTLLDGNLTGDSN